MFMRDLKTWRWQRLRSSRSGGYLGSVDFGDFSSGHSCRVACGMSLTLTATIGLSYMDWLIAAKSRTALPRCTEVQ
jgi:hypothetical protein